MENNDIRIDKEHAYMSNKERHLFAKRIQKASNGIFGFFLRKQRIVSFLLLFIILWGFFAVATLPREANPEIQIPVVIVTTTWPGASPLEVEELVTNKIEAKLENLQGLKSLTSSSFFSVSVVKVEFEADENLDEAIRRTQDEVQKVSNLPLDADDPEVVEVRFENIPIITLSLVGELSPEDLKGIAEGVKNELSLIDGVSKVEIIGGRKREYLIELDPGRMAQFGLTITGVSRSITQANITLPLGDFELDGKNYTLLAIGRIVEADEFGDIVLKQTEFGPVLLRDVGVISDQLSEAKTISRISIAGDKPGNTLSLQVFKSTGGNIINIADESLSKVEILRKKKVIPEAVDLVVTNDNSKLIRKDLSTLGRSGVQTLILIFIALSLALALRMAVIATISIPIIFLMSLGVIQLEGVTLNSLTLFSLVLSLGLLVDTVIVLVEGIYEALRKGYTTQEAALYSIETYKGPITAGVLTTVAAFIPMFLVGGIVGEFLKTLPLTISAVLGSSLVVALVIMPGLASVFLAKFMRRKPIRATYVQRKFILRLVRCYKPLIYRLLTVKKIRKYFMSFLVVLFLISLGLVGSGIIKTELFPRVDIDFFVIEIEMPRGTALSVTDSFIKKIEERLVNREDVENFVTSVGSSFSLDVGETTSVTSNIGSIVVNLVDEKERNLKSYEVSDEIRLVLSDMQDEARITIEDPEGGPPTGEPVAVRVVGPDLSELSKVSDRIKDVLKEVSGVVNIQSTDKSLPPEFSFKLDHERIGRFGLTVAEVTQGMRGALAGITASTLEFEGEDIDINIKFSVPQDMSVDELQNFEFPLPNGGLVKLSSVAKFSLQPALEIIRHDNGERFVRVTAKNEERSIREIQTDIQSKLNSFEVPSGYRIDTIGEFQDEQQAFVDLYYAMIVAVMLITFLMVVQFNSYRQTLVVLMTLPLGFIGVIVGILIFGLPFGFATFLGIVALTGIVVNDAIVLIDRINKNIKERDMELIEAITEAGEARLQPILLTTITTVLGVIPLAFADEFWFGLTVALATGLVFSTILTLFVIPILYQNFEQKRINKQKHVTESINLVNGN